MSDKIKVFASDDNLKALGELLSNDSSRNIIFNLMNKAMYTNEISTKLDLRVSLVIHHLKKMEDLGLLEITERQIIKKGQQHRFFQIKSNIFITINKTNEDIEKQGFLKTIFKEGIKFAAIGIIAFTSYLFTLPTDLKELAFMSQDELNLTIPFLIIIIGLIIERIFSIIKKKKSMID